MEICVNLHIEKCFFYGEITHEIQIIKFGTSFGPNLDNWQNGPSAYKKGHLHNA